MGKSKVKPKKSCCGKYKKDGKHCSRCPILVKANCMALTEAKEQGKKSKKNAKKKDKRGKKKKE